jgi:hypothetical protein
MQSLDQTQGIEVPVVVPCLEKMVKAFGEHNIAEEILEADNGSTDLSRTIAEREGARVVPVKEPYYGSASMGELPQQTADSSLSGTRAINGFSSPFSPKPSPLPRDSFHQTGTWHASSKS